MLTRLKLKREGNIVVESPQVRSRTMREIFPQSPPQIPPQVVVGASATMSHEGEPENMLEDEKSFRNTFFDMKQMVKFLYEERNTRLQGESSNPRKGDKSSKGDGGDGDKNPKGNGNGDKPPLTPPSSPLSSPSSSSTTSPSQTPPHSPKGHGKTPFLKLDIKFDLPMYDGKVDAERLDNWVR